MDETENEGLAPPIYPPRSPDPSLPRFSLYDMDGVGLIVQLSTGVVYSNQTGGTACLQPEIEGALLPVNPDGQIGDPNPLERKLCEVFKGASGYFRRRMVPVIDKILEQFGETRGLRVDSSKLQYSHEAWVYVTIQEVENGGVRGLECPLGGVLTWANSD